MRITLVHGNIFAPDEEEAEVTVLMAKGIHSKVINPTKVLKYPSVSVSVFATPVRTSASGLAQVRSYSVHHTLMTLLTPANCEMGHHTAQHNYISLRSDNNGVIPSLASCLFFLFNCRYQLID